MDNLSISKTSYLIEGRPYPVCILGGDKFCDWFSVLPPTERLTAEYAYSIMELSYELGVRGFDISCRFNLIEAFSRLRKKFPDAIGIGNPNWMCGYKLGNLHLWDIRDRVISTIVQRRLNQKSELAVNDLLMAPEVYRFEKFIINKNNINPLTESEIQQIYIDEDIWLNRMKMLQGMIDFCLVGSDYADWMCGLGRLDLLRWQIDSVRKHGMIPVSVSSWADMTIPILEKEDFPAHWIYADRAQMSLNHELAINAVRNASKPVTAFKILGQTGSSNDIESNISWLQRLGVKSFVLGLENLEQAKESWPKIIRTLSLVD